MLVGIDFDNTIVGYDETFHVAAVERGLIPPEIPRTKLAVRDHLRGIGQEDSWTELQGHVYGARMRDVRAFPGAIEFMLRARAAGHDLAIVSHKTRWPFLGERHDLHAAARAWVEENLSSGGAPLVPAVHFELTKEDKLRRIAELGCDAFIDDLPEILLAPGFPGGTARLLFDPDLHHGETHPELRVMRSWDEIADALCGQPG